MSALRTNTYVHYLNSERLMNIFLSAGILLRLFLYFQNNSLWLDEQYLSNSIVSYSLKELLTVPLLYYQKAPLGFLMMQKLFVTVFSPSEMSLRLFPLLCNIASLFLFITICRYFLKENMIWLAVAIFSLAPPLIFHAVEAKQYSSELLSSVIAMCLYIRLQIKGANRSDLVKMAVAGTILIWFSYSVIFILVAISLVVSFKILKKRGLKGYMYYFIVFFIWMTSFVINYYFSTYKHAESKWTIYWFDYYRHFAPLPPKNMDELTWYALRFYRLLNNPLGLWWNFMAPVETAFSPVLKLTFIPVILFFTGIIGFLRRKADIVLLSGAILLTLFISGLKLYPLTDRFWVFLAPVFIIVIVRGCGYVNDKLLPKKMHFILPLLLVTGPVTNAIAAFSGPEFIIDKTSSQRQALQYINGHYKEGDGVYIYWNAKSGYQIYNQLYHWKFKAMEGTDYRKQADSFNNYMNLLKKEIYTAGKERVWVVLNYTFQSDIGEPIDWPKWYFNQTNKPSNNVIAFLGKDWKIVDEYKYLDVHVYCFQLN